MHIKQQQHHKKKVWSKPSLLLRATKTILGELWPHSLAIKYCKACSLCRWQRARTSRIKRHRVENHRKLQAFQHRLIQSIALIRYSDWPECAKWIRTNKQKKSTRTKTHIGIANVWLTFWCYDYYGWRWNFYHTDVVASETPFKDTICNVCSC